MGGLSKKGYQLETLRQERQQPAITVDAGGLLFPSRSLPPNRAAQEKRTAQGIVEAYNLMGFQAVGIAGEDLAAGVDYLRQLATKSDFAWLSANLIDTESRRPIFTGFTLLSAGPSKVAVIGLTGKQVMPLIADEEHVVLQDWRQLLPSLLPEVARQSDMIVLLSSYSAQENIAMARAFPQIHIIIQATGSSGNRPPNLTNNTLITQVAARGKYLGDLQIDWQPSKMWDDRTLAERLKRQQEALDRYTWQINRLKKRGAPEELYKDAPQKLTGYHNLLQKQKSLADAVADLQQQLAAKKPNATPLSTYTSNLIALESTMPDQPEVLAVVTLTKKAINDLGRSAAATAAAGKGTAAGNTAAGGLKEYIGWKACIGCHTEVTQKWQATRHAGAYDTLVEKDQQFNQECLACHVTGYQQSDPFLALSLPEELLAVGCEVCHGPAASHATNPKQHQLPTLPRETVCRRCHTPEQDDHFDFQHQKQLVH